MECIKILKMVLLLWILKFLFELILEVKKIFWNMVKVMMEENVLMVLDIFVLINFVFFYGEFIDVIIKL